jgi:hypothetical protein
MPEAVRRCDLFAPRHCQAQWLRLEALLRRILEKNADLPINRTQKLSPWNFNTPQPYLAIANPFWKNSPDEEPVPID